MQTKELASLRVRKYVVGNTFEVHPRGDGKSAQALGRTRDSGAPLRKRVRKRMKIRGLYVCDKKERS
jgi:hypothetical protein